MATLDDKIAGLETELNGLNAELTEFKEEKKTSSAERKLVLEERIADQKRLITSRSEVLKLLLEEKKTNSTGVGAQGSGAGYVYTCTITNSKLRKCCRFRVFQLAEKHHAKVRVSQEGVDGMTYPQDAKNLSIQLVFSELGQAEDFQSDIRKIPSHYRKRKPLDDSAILDIRVEDQPIAVIALGADPVKRMFESDYALLGDDAEPSELCDGESVAGSSHTEVVNLTEEVKLQLLDKEDGHLLYKSNPERCHLMSQTTYTQYKDNSDNVLYMSRFLHSHFDTMNKVDGIPTFAVEYVSHHPDPITKTINGRDWLCYETTVKVVFRTEADKNVLCVHFKDYSVKNSREIETTLHFKNPVGKAVARGMSKGFKEFANFKAVRTYDAWRSYAGIDGDEDD